MVSISDSIDQLGLSYKLSIETILEKSINDEKPISHIWRGMEWREV